MGDPAGKEEASKIVRYPTPMTVRSTGKDISVEALAERLLELPVSDRGKISGIHTDRADAILGGALVYRTVLREAGLEGVFISGQGVREGAFYRQFLPAQPDHLLRNVRDFSVQNLFAH